MGRTKIVCCVWLIDMGDGSWVATCESCGLLCRGSKTQADQAGTRHEGQR
jgi:hypothetical protein